VDKQTQSCKSKSGFFSDSDEKILITLVVAERVNFHY